MIASRALMGLRSPAVVGRGTRITTMMMMPTLYRSFNTSLQMKMKSEEYHPISKVETDPITGKKTLSIPMTVNDELPDPLLNKNKTRNSFITFCLVMGISLFGIFNYEKVSSPVMNATMYCLRRSEVARSIIGKEITFEGLFPWIKGELNTMKGKINVRVWVSGDKGHALMCLIANRDSRMQEFQIERWELIFEGGKIVNLLDDESISLSF
ncbi:hypothetical protein CANARDRAFT_28839 [[Candida] arabinofermentans NRRL YB-2248]|uniref:DUF1783-domain-containing protein n=1 Tax=[Candida] arabinofermentans NRRL YB-2248 TaxID=983967 RepID=A0A1E4SYU5_9ASCO|nr:hypothetical protein CANARDRAFT_28839 [[Candida] arabinofermentans NRRL YB-2248]